MIHSRLWLVLATLVSCGLLIWFLRWGGIIYVLALLAIVPVVDERLQLRRSKPPTRYQLRRIRTLQRHHECADLVGHVPRTALDAAYMIRAMRRRPLREP